MKKIYNLVISLIAFSTYTFAQAPVPVPLYSFDVPFPNNGWSNSLLLGAGTATTYASPPAANTAPSCRLDATGEFVQIWLAGQAGNVKYFIKSNTNLSTPFQGNFTVQESPDGITWTTLRDFQTGVLSIASFMQYTDLPIATTRYIRWYFTNKQPNYNVALDDIQIDAPLLQVPEINASQGTNIVLNNGYANTTANLGDSSLITINFQNAGSQGYLNFGVPVLSGPNASDYSIVSSPDSIAPLGNQNMVLKFIPSALGTRDAIVTLSNNDGDENPFVINLYGTGGPLASEPIAQPTSLTFNNIKTYRLSGSFTPSAVDNFGGFIVVRSNSALPANIAPTDGKTYGTGDTVSTYKVVYSSTSTSFNSNEIYAGTNYTFTVWAYNGQDLQRNYLQANPLSASVTTPATLLPANEYNGITPTASTFISDLHTLINPHTSIFYSNYTGTILNKFTARDTTLGRKVITSVYSGKQVIYTPPLNLVATDLSREHSYAHSWMPTFPADVSGPNNSELPEYNDQHHLFPALLTNENALRSNDPFGEVVNATVTNGQCKSGTDANGAQVFEPSNKQKGNTARALFYMCVCYNGISNNTWNLPPNVISSINQNLEVLKKWHYQDPPDAFEIARNDYLDSLQGNRNPFIDNPDWVCFINFKNMTHIANPILPCNGAIDSSCAAPVLQVIDSISYTTAKISWQPTSGATNYILKYKKATASIYSQVTTVNTNYTLTGLLDGTAYNFKVIAVCAAGEGLDPATIGSFTTTDDVGITEFNSESVSISPNPSNGIFRVATNLKSGTNVNVSIIDITGRVCYNELKGASSSNFEVVTNNLKAGIYTMRISTKFGTSNNKIVIE